MFTLDFVINPFVLVIALIAGIAVGFLFKRKKINKLNRRIMQLEEEMMTSHAEILEIQKAYVRLETDLKEQSIPVISMKLDAPKEGNKGKLSK